MSRKTDYCELVPRAENPNSYTVIRREEAQLEPLTEAHSLTPPSRTEESVTGDHYNRARAFTLRTASLAAVTGAGLLIVAKIVVAFPLWSLAAVAWFVGGFTLVWLLSFTLDLLVSPSGIDLFHAVSFWRYMDREQAERHRRARQ